MYFVMQKYSFLCPIFYYNDIIFSQRESICHINWMKSGSVLCLQCLFNKVALTIGLLQMTGPVLGGVCGSETHIYCTITLALLSWELSSLEERSEHFTLCIGTVSQCQSMSIPLLVTVPFNTSLLLIRVMFVYCWSPKQPNHLISLDFTKFNSSSKWAHLWNISGR